MIPHQQTRQQLRQQIRAQRRQLSIAEREQAAQQLCERVAQQPIFQQAQHISGYLAFEGEVDIAALLQQAVALGKQVYLPVLLGKGEPMMFAPYQLGAALKRNYFDILEPDVDQSLWIQPAQLDLVLTPLVAFDADGNRLGVGGGFYDRSFAFIRENKKAKTKLLGIAYEMQRLQQIESQDWDVPLHTIATEARLYLNTKSKT